MNVKLVFQLFIVFLRIIWLLTRIKWIKDVHTSKKMSNFRDRSVIRDRDPHRGSVHCCDAWTCDITQSQWDVISRNRREEHLCRKLQEKLEGMRCRWKRGRPSCRKFLCFTCIVVFIIVVYTFINEEGSRFEKQWSCEELRAKELLIELVSSSVCPFVTMGINFSTISAVFYDFIRIPCRSW